MVGGLKSERRAREERSLAVLLRVYSYVHQVGSELQYEWKRRTARRRATFNRVRPKAICSSTVQVHHRNNYQHGLSSVQFRWRYPSIHDKNKSAATNKRNMVHTLSSVHQTRLRGLGHERNGEVRERRSREGSQWHSQ